MTRYCEILDNVFAEFVNTNLNEGTHWDIDDILKYRGERPIYFEYNHDNAIYIAALHVADMCLIIELQHSKHFEQTTVNLSENPTAFNFVLVQIFEKTMSHFEMTLDTKSQKLSVKFYPNDENYTFPVLISFEPGDPDEGEIIGKSLTSNTIENKQADHTLCCFCENPILSSQAVLCEEGAFCEPVCNNCFKNEPAFHISYCEGVTMCDEHWWFHLEECNFCFLKDSQ